MKIKICGITNSEDALNAIALGADALGFNFVKQSPRYVEPAMVEQICLFLPPFVSAVGVFADHSAEEVDAIADRCRLDLIQLHGEESPQFCMQRRHRVIKAFRVAEPEDLIPISQYRGMVCAILLDSKVKGAKGGTGQTFDWGLAIRAKEYDVPLILAGGVQPGNIQKAVQLVHPYALDICSGVESEPGKKDYTKMQSVIQSARSL